MIIEKLNLAKAVDVDSARRLGDVCSLRYTVMHSNKYLVLFKNK